MKKSILLALMAALTVSLSACRRSTAPSVVPGTGNMTVPTGETATMPTMTLPIPDDAQPNTVAPDGFVHPTEDSGATHAESTAPTAEDPLRRMIPNK